MFTSMDTMITILIGLLSFVVGLIAILIYQSQVNKNRRARNDVTTDNRFKGMTFVIIGKFQELNGSLIRSLVQSMGGRVSNSISSHTTYVVAGEDAEEQVIKAQELGVTVISENELIRMAR